MSNRIDIFIQARDQASAALRGVGNSMASVTNQALAFGLTAVGIAGVGAAIATASQALIGYNAKMEQTSMGLETMLGNAAAAQLFIMDMKDFAARTPFEFEDVDKAGKKLLAFGWAARDIIPDLTAIGNAASGLGLQKDGIDRITLALGQMSIKAHISGEEVRQLNEAGIGAQQYLVKAFNLTGDAFNDLSKTGVTGIQGMRAIIEGMRNDPKFKDMMERQSKTAIGSWSTIKDTAKEVFGYLGQGSFGAVSVVISNFAEMSAKAVKALREGGIASALVEIFPSEWAERLWKIGDLFDQMGGAGSAAGKLIHDGLLPAIGAATDLGIVVVSGALTGFQSLAEFAVNNLPLVEGALAGVTTAYIAMNYAAIAANVTAAWSAAETVALTAIYVGEALALGEVALAMGLLMGPVGWAALAIGGLTAAFMYYSSKVDESQESTQIYVDGFGYVGDAAETAAAKVWKLTAAQSAYYKAQSGVGGEYEDMASRKLASNKDNARSYLNNHTSGNAPILPGDNGKAAKKAATLGIEMDQATDKIATMFANLREKIISETGTSYQVGMFKIQDEVANMYRDLKTLSDKLAKDGLSIDMGPLKAKIEEYSVTMMEPITRAWKEAWADLKNQTAMSGAQLLGDKSKIADAEYEIAKAALDKEKRERLKAVQKDPNDAEAALAVNAYYDAKLKQLNKKRLDDQTQDKLDAYDRESAMIQASYDLHEKSQEQIDVLNRNTWENKKKFLEDELKKEGLTVERILALRQQLADLQGKIDATPIAKQEGIDAGLKGAYKEFGTEFSNWQDLAKSAALSMRDTFADFFFDAMTGKLKSLGEYFTSFFKSVAKAISQMMANMFAKQIIGSIFPNLKMQATGGPTELNRTTLVGERGPELFVPQSAGKIVPTSELFRTNAEQQSQVQQSQTKAQSVEIPISFNLINNSGQQVQAKQQGPAQFDGQRYVISVVLDAFARDVMGMRTVMTGGAR